MKSLLITLAIIGLVYLVFIDSKKPGNKDNRPDVNYQQETEKARELENFMQNTVDKNLNKTDQIN